PGSAVTSPACSNISRISSSGIAGLAASAAVQPRNSVFSPSDSRLAIVPPPRHLRSSFSHRVVTQGIQKVAAVSTDLCQLSQKRLRLLQDRRPEALGEPAINRREQVAGFGAFSLVAPEPGEARGGAEFPKLGVLLLCDRDCLAIAGLGRSGIAYRQ